MTIIHSITDLVCSTLRVLVSATGCTARQKEFVVWRVGLDLELLGWMRRK